jgi:hypothetical protein
MSKGKWAEAQQIILKTMNMNKKLHFLIALISLVFLCNPDLSAQNVAINATGAAPNGSAMLDITSTTMGILIPRMTTGQRIAIGTPATGLKVYDTTTGTFWYYNGTVWVEELSGTNGWMLAGNTLAGTEKLGSINAQPVRFFANNTERMRLLSNGNFLVGGTAAVYAGDLMEGIGSATFPFPISGYTGIAGAIGLYGSASGGTNSIGTYGVSNGPNGFGMQAFNSNATGSGLIASGNNLAGSYLTTGCGGAFTGVTGVLGITSSATGMALDGRNLNASGTAVIGSGNNIAGTYLVSGSGGAFKGFADGLFAYNTSLGVSEAIYTNNGGVICRVNYWSGIQYKIIGTGTVSCVIPDTAGQMRVMHCTESPEIYFSDYGEAKLVNGRAHIEIDPNLAKNIVINEKHPLRAYVQLEGDCNGVYITNKTATGFDVVELQGGTSNVSFQWNIVCNVADAELPNGRQSKYSDARLELAPQPKEQVDLDPALSTAPPVVKKDPK